jgi:protein-tyrosine phosphatase
MIQVLFVCMGNICRSPTAEIIFANHIKEANLLEHIDCDSAGTHAYHVGHSPDLRSQDAVKKRGLDMSHLVARQVTINDLKSFDYIVAMDTDNFENLLALAPSSHKDKVSLLLSHAVGLPDVDVPDPYYGGDRGFDLVYDLVEKGVVGLLSSIRDKHDI